MLKSSFASTLLPGLVICTLTVAALESVAAELEAFKPVGSPKIAPASDEGEKAIKRFKAPPGMKVELFAAEPHLANPVAFRFDEKGRCYVCETFRHFAGVLDIRGIMDWLDEELACRTVDDRLAEMKRHLGDRLKDFTVESERVKLLEDRDGDGRVDHSTVFADGFNTVLDGIGASVLPRNGKVWYTDIPNLWLLEDTKGDGVADVRKSLHYGFGVRVGFLGHDLHGLRFGPDGKLYFSIGDRGSNIKVNDKMVGNPDTGGVFRCNPDGSGLELFAFGLRNPQDLTFDQYGNLFTGDNNSDSGDEARWVYVVEGGDSGWRIGYQFLEGAYSRGPFNLEKLWYPSFPGQAAYIVPPIANIANGPSGTTYFPGTGLPDRYREHFFLCDFKGAPVNSGIHSFALKPKGASFEMIDREHFLWNILATDVDFGVEGGVYVSDWVEGWNKTGKGRIYRVFDPANVNTALVKETKRLIGAGTDHRSETELARLLAHADIRVRQAAQFALADNGSVRTLTRVARAKASPLARLHAIWGLGQIAVRTPAALDPVIALLSDPDAEVRAQSAKVVGEGRDARTFTGLLTLLHDPTPRARFFAAMSLGKLGRKEAVSPLLTMLRENADKDPLLRHAGVMGLTWINDMPALLAAARDPAPAVRMGVLLAMRRLQRYEIVMFLQDPEPALVLEAARAINDEPINAGMKELAALLEHPTQSEPLLRRVIAANFRYGTPSTAAALAQFSARNDPPENMRREALEALGDWPKPSGRDRVLNLWRPISAVRDIDTPRDALRPVIAGILQGAPASVRIVAAHDISRLGIDEANPVLFKLVGDQQSSGQVRAAALAALAGRNDPRLEEALRLAHDDPDQEVRSQAIRLHAQVKPASAVGEVVSVLEKGTVAEKQNALTTLGTVGGTGPDEVIAQWLDKLLAGQVAPELQLDLLQAATKRPAAAVKEKLTQYAASKPKDDPLADFRETLFGGNVEEGRKIFFDRPEAACVRCHKVKGEGGEVGPELTGIASRQKREYFLESILFPNKQIAPGFESLLVTMKNGALYAGLVKSETAQELVLNSPEDGLLTLKKSDIKSREHGLSAMPEGMAAVLSKEDLRHLIEFLASLK